jgi:hypothetical protein
MVVLVVVLIIVAMVAVAAAAWFFSRQRRSTALREQFGPEYDRAVRTSGDRRQAEQELAARQERVRQLHIRPLPAEEQARYADAWRTTQGRFVDDPPGAIGEADNLIGQVMQARGYPVGDFEARAADLSVDHPKVVSNYRAAHRLAQASAAGQASTEDLRQAFVHYRALFEELVETPQEVGR